MNKERRKAIQDLIDTAQALSETLEGEGELRVTEEVRSDLSALADDIENIRDEEQDYYDNMPEGFQNGDKGQNAEAAVQALDEAIDRVRDAESALESGEGEDGKPTPPGEDEFAEAVANLSDAISSLDEATA